jgi:uroporphyrinogen decarboxylase
LPKNLLPPSQPWRSFKPDGVILFSDILTPLPGIGVSFEIDDNKGPLLDDPIRSADQVRLFDYLNFHMGLQFRLGWCGV